MRLFFRLILLVTLCGCCLLPAGGCGGPEPEKEPVHLVYRLKWLYNISVIGDLYAEEKGFFARQGLQVDIKPGGPERDAIKELEIGRSQFGVASADQVIRAVAKGSPIVVLAQLFQANPLQWIYRQGKQPIQSPADLRHRIIGITYGGNDETIFRALMAKYQIRKDELTLFGVRYDYTPFYQRKVDLWPVYRNAEGIIISDKLKKGGEKVNFFNPDTFGIRFVANSVITTRQMIQNHPQTVRKFIHALIKGWQQALDPVNADSALTMMARFDKDTPAALLRQQLMTTRALMIPPAGKNFGWINAPAWKQSADIMLAQKLIPAPVRTDDILILEKIGGKI
ncbi:MAG TPA: nitrate ABC transporter substrate-binding protein [Desulfobulbaceae bacterium]|nr:nitrate ABC transporter substrate-binding protein [Desulfobulbaceae bacterium]